MWANSRIVFVGQCFLLAWLKIIEGQSPFLVVLTPMFVGGILAFVGLLVHPFFVLKSDV